ncbi:MAG: hypothetical protein M3143_06795, partial [Actinomycetota bacterium]|nr:hypothetical protein [Actinomycetota bacterium]
LSDERDLDETIPAAIAALAFLGLGDGKTYASRLLRPGSGLYLITSSGVVDGHGCVWVISISLSSPSPGSASLSWQARLYPSP